MSTLGLYFCSLALPATAAEPAEPPPTASPSPEIVQPPAPVDMYPYETVVREHRPTDAPWRSPFPQQSDIVLRRDDILRQGAANLADALNLIPEVGTHDSGRGGLRTDIRGARQRAVMVMIDGVVVDEPYYGGFDIASIPLTDIVEIRVRLDPAAPLDGVGGSGGVVEVTTMRASGTKRLRTSTALSSLPGANLSVTGRTPVSSDLAVRASVSGSYAAQPYDVSVSGQDIKTINNPTKALQATVRTEQQTGYGRYQTDLWAQRRSYLAPPSSEDGASVLWVDGEDTVRLGIQGEKYAARTHFSGRAYGTLLRRTSRRYTDALQESVQTEEHLQGDRVGIAALADGQFSTHTLFALRMAMDSEHVTVGDLAINNVTGRVTMGELAAGTHIDIGNWLVQSSVGLFVPLLTSASVWPEAKITVSYQVHPNLTLTGIAARKGRLPTLRERFAQNIGNRSLNPEQATFGEFDTTFRPHALLHTQVRTYGRFTQDLIRLDPNKTILENFGDVRVYGVESNVIVAKNRSLSGGGLWDYAYASSPLDFFPHHKGKVWLTFQHQHVGAIATGRYVGKRLDSQQVLPAYVTLDLSLWAKWRRAATVTLRIENILNNKYQTRPFTRSPGQVVSIMLEGIWD